MDQLEMAPVRSPTFLPFTKRSNSDQMTIILFTSSCQEIAFLAISIKYKQHHKSAVDEEDSVQKLVKMVATALENGHGLVFCN